MFSIPLETRLLNLVEQHIKMGLRPTEMVDPETKKNVNIPTILNIMKDYIKKNEGKYFPVGGNVTTGGGNDDLSGMPFIPPVYTQNEQPVSFQYQVQKFIRDIPFEYKLNYLNKIQETCPFLIVDPLTGTLAQNNVPVNYGYADLYRFLGLSLIPGMHNPQQIKFLKVPPSKKDYRPKLLPDPYTNYYAFQERPLDANPFYHPINYPIPDKSGNEILMKIKMESPSELFNKIKNLHSKIYSMYLGGNTNQPIEENGIMTGKGNLEGGADKIQTDFEEIFKLFDYLFKKMYDPEFILTDMSGPERPMKKYFKSNFHNLLTQMMIAHGVYNYSNKKPTDDFEISSASADYYEKNKDVVPKIYENFQSKKPGHLDFNMSQKKFEHPKQHKQSKHKIRSRK